MDVGSELTAVLLDGQRITGKLTFGDVARAEMQAGVNFMQKFQQRDGITVVDLAQLTFQIAVRTKQYTADLNQWVLDLDTFEFQEEEAAPSNGNGAAPNPFPLAAQAES